MSTPPWPGYTPPSSGSSQNDGTHPITAYQAIETGLATQLGNMGYDTSQMPAQAYGDITAQNVDHPERHAPPTAPTGVVAAASGTSGTVRVTWVAPTVIPSQGYTVTLSSGQSVSVGNGVVTANVPGATVGASVTATVTSVGAWVTATSAASAAYTVV